VTAGTVMHGSKLPLTEWFQAPYPKAAHSNPISALQVHKQFGLGSYLPARSRSFASAKAGKSAWLLCAKLL